MDNLLLITYYFLILQTVHRQCLGGIIHPPDDSVEDTSIEDDHPRHRRIPLLPMMTSSTGSRLNTVELVIRPDESEIERAERTNREFEKLIQFATIVGQVDSFITHKARILIRALAKLTEEDEADIHYH